MGPDVLRVVMECNLPGPAGTLMLDVSPGTSLEELLDRLKARSEGQVLRLLQHSSPASSYAVPDSIRLQVLACEVWMHLPPALAPSYVALDISDWAQQTVSDILAPDAVAGSGGPARFRVTYGGLPPDVLLCMGATCGAARAPAPPGWAAASPAWAPGGTLDQVLTWTAGWTARAAPGSQPLGRAAAASSGAEVAAPAAQSNREAKAAASVGDDDSGGDRARSTAKRRKTTKGRAPTASPINIFVLSSPLGEQGVFGAANGAATPFPGFHRSTNGGGPTTGPGAPRVSQQQGARLFVPWGGLVTDTLAERQGRDASTHAPGCGHAAHTAEGPPTSNQPPPGPDSRPAASASARPASQQQQQQQHVAAPASQASAGGPNAGKPGTKGLVSLFQGVPPPLNERQQGEVPQAPASASPAGTAIPLSQVHGRKKRKRGSQATNTAAASAPDSAAALAALPLGSLGSPGASAVDAWRVAGRMTLQLSGLPPTVPATQTEAVGEGCDADGDAGGRSGGVTVTDLVVPTTLAQAVDASAPAPGVAVDRQGDAHAPVDAAGPPDPRLVASVVKALHGAWDRASKARVAITVPELAGSQRKPQEHGITGLSKEGAYVTLGDLRGYYAEDTQQVSCCCSQCASAAVRAWLESARTARSLPDDALLRRLRKLLRKDKGGVARRLDPGSHPPHAVPEPHSVSEPNPPPEPATAAPPALRRLMKLLPRGSCQQWAVHGCEQPDRWQEVIRVPALLTEAQQQPCTISTWFASTGNKAPRRNGRGWVPGRSGFISANGAVALHPCDQPLSSGPSYGATTSALGTPANQPPSSGPFAPQERQTLGLGHKPTVQGTGLAAPSGAAGAGGPAPAPATTTAATSARDLMDLESQELEELTRGAQMPPQLLSPGGPALAALPSPSRATGLEAATAPPPDSEAGGVVSGAGDGAQRKAERKAVRRLAKRQARERTREQGEAEPLTQAMSPEVDAPRVAETAGAAVADVEAGRNPDLDAAVAQEAAAASPQHHGGDAPVPAAKLSKKERKARKRKAAEEAAAAVAQMAPPAAETAVAEVRAPETVSPIAVDALAPMLADAAQAEPGDPLPALAPKKARRGELRSTHPPPADIPAPVEPGPSTSAHGAQSGDGMAQEPSQGPATSPSGQAESEGAHSGSGITSGKATDSDTGPSSGRGSGSAPPSGAAAASGSNTSSRSSGSESGASGARSGSPGPSSGTSSTSSASSAPSEASNGVGERAMDGPGFEAERSFGGKPMSDGMKLILDLCRRTGKSGLEYIMRLQNGMALESEDEDGPATEAGRVPAPAAPSSLTPAGDEQAGGRAKRGSTKKRAVPKQGAAAAKAGEDDGPAAPGPQVAGITMDVTAPPPRAMAMLRKSLALHLREYISAKRLRSGRPPLLTNMRFAPEDKPVWWPEHVEYSKAGLTAGGREETELLYRRLRSAVMELQEEVAHAERNEA